MSKDRKETAQNPTNNIIYIFYEFVKNEVRIIKPESKILSIALKGLVVLLVLLTIFLIIISAIFYVGDTAPSLFGHNVYLVKTDAFSLIKSGTALITEEVEFSRIKAGNIVVYSTENNKAAVAEIHEANVYDGVYTYNAKSADGDDIYIGQSSVIGKGMFFSDFLGAIISFAVSPAGVAVIAIIPCLLIIVFEVVKYFRKRLPQPEIETVKKQEETPTYVPYQRPTPQSRPVQQYEHKPAPPVMDIVIPADPTDADAPVFTPQPKREQVINTVNPFFQPPKARVQQKPQSPQPMRNTAPISSRKLDEIIAQTKAEHRQPQQPSPASTTMSLEEQRERERAIREIQQKRAAALADEQRRDSASRVHVPTGVVKETTQPRVNLTPPRQPADNVKQYVPKKPAAEHKNSSPLDRLLREEQVSDQRYNIDDILKSIEKKY